MKKLILSLTLTGLMVTTPLASTSMADVFQTINKTYNLEAAPIDVTGSLDGKYTFVLAEGGKIYIYSAAGEKNEIQVDPAMDRIFATGMGDKIYLSSKKTKKVQEIFIDFTQNIDIEGSPFLGGENAPVTIVAFSDFQWPHCAKLGALFEQVLDKYSDNVKIVFKHFPLSNHRFAAAAALATIAAQEQGKFWQYHDMVFEDHKNLSNEKFSEYARKLGLNMPLFSKVMNAKETKDKVIKDHSNGRDAGVSGTPTVFINGRKLRKRTFEGFQKLIETELKRTSSI